MAAMRIYTKTGDKGETGLFGGRRVPKDHHRVAAYGDIDELNAFLGQALSKNQELSIQQTLRKIQELLFELGAELATPPESRKHQSTLRKADIAWLEKTIDEAETQLSPLKSFILPGGGEAAAALHTARAVCRRAERSVVTLCREEPQTSPQVLIFINRLADLLFVLARLANAKAGVEDLPWNAR